ncbi:MAG TPA: ABC transporter permease subunit [Planctomycetota bacterium]|nr:ABC transporter permease subunit [Planctomycetota bacterium]
MLRNVFLKTLRDARQALLWWSLGLVGMTAVIVAIFPTVRDSPELNRLVEDYPEALKAFIAFGGELDYSSGAGYLGMELFSLMVPLLLLIAAIGAGARAVAGEEEHGTLDLLLANPISRRRLALEKLAALASELAVLALVLWVSLLVGVTAVGMDVSAARLGAATASAALLALGFGAIALLVGAASGRRGLAIGVAAAGAVAAWLVDSLAALVDALEPVRTASPFYHYAASDPLRHGLAPGHVGVLVLLCATAAALAPLALERRDLRG